MAKMNIEQYTGNGRKIRSIIEKCDLVYNNVSAAYLKDETQQYDTRGHGDGTVHYYTVVGKGYDVYIGNPAFNSNYTKQMDAYNNGNEQVKESCTNLKKATEKLKIPNDQQKIQMNKIIECLNKMDFGDQINKKISAMINKIGAPKKTEIPYQNVKMKNILNQDSVDVNINDVNDLIDACKECLIQANNIEDQLGEVKKEKQEYDKAYEVWISIGSECKNDYKGTNINDQISKIERKNSRIQKWIQKLLNFATTSYDMLEQWSKANNKKKTTAKDGTNKSTKKTKKKLKIYKKTAQNKLNSYGIGIAGASSIISEYTKKISNAKTKKQVKKLLSEAKSKIKNLSKKSTTPKTPVTPTKEEQDKTNESGADKKKKVETKIDTDKTDNKTTTAKNKKKTTSAIKKLENKVDDLTKQLKKEQKANKNLKKEAKAATAAATATATKNAETKIADLTKQNEAKIKELKEEIEITTTKAEQQITEKTNEFNKVIATKDQEINNLKEQVNNLQQQNNQTQQQLNNSNKQLASAQQSAQTASSQTTQPTAESNPTQPEVVPEETPVTTTETPEVEEPEVSTEVEEPIVIEPEPETTTNSKKSGSSAIPAILGVGAAGAATVAGVRYIKNKNKSDDDYEEDSSEEDYNDQGSNNETYAYESPNSESIPSERYRAGSINKLVLDEQNDININDDYEDDDQDEELE